MIEKQLSEASTLIGLELERTLSLLREQPMLETLEVKQELWARRQLLTITWLDGRPRARDRAVSQTRMLTR